LYFRFAKISTGKYAPLTRRNRCRTKFTETDIDNIKDIDSKEMRIFVKGGKTKRDHYTILSQTTLDALRDYWRKFRPNSPEGWLFPGTKNIGHITRAAVALAFDNCVNRTGIAKEVSPHSLRHRVLINMFPS